MPEIGEHVTVEWPGDTIAFKVPEGKSAGDTVKLKIASILRVVSADVPVVAVNDVAVTESVGPNYSSPRGPRPTRGGTYANPTPKTCRDCGTRIFLWHSGRTGRWYPCDNLDAPGSFHSKTCTGRKVATP